MGQNIRSSDYQYIRGEKAKSLPACRQAGGLQLTAVSERSERAVSCQPSAKIHASFWLKDTIIIIANGVRLTANGCK